MSALQSRISVVSKLDGIPSWSLQAVDTCPGAKENGELVEVCKGCYARGGNYRFKAVRNTREINRKAWRRKNWVPYMIGCIDPYKYFRWFDSGDVYCRGLGVKIYEVISGTPNTKHWLPTRSYKFPKLYEILEEINKLPNACVRYSGDKLDIPPNIGQNKSIVLSKPNNNVFTCGAYKQVPAKCNGCRACWDKEIPTIGYKAHGRIMLKVINNGAD